MGRVAGLVSFVSLSALTRGQQLSCYVHERVARAEGMGRRKRKTVRLTNEL